ncbi:MAG: dethiobiotin synthase [Rhodocyclaceae bacterium]|nr:MAG: dethiobiotin synthase [Rhodocyclaceae bacterium]
MHSTNGYFITGTDTEVGKTFVTCKLLHAARHIGLSAIGMKPVAAGVGCDGRNEDVELLVAASSSKAPIEWVNPYCFSRAIAPHLAALAENRVIAAATVLSAFRNLQKQANLVLVEGVGGFRVPLGPSFDSVDLAKSLNLPVILVVGLRLGCLNHALLTAGAIELTGLNLVGWVANCIDPEMPSWAENVVALQERIVAPLLGILPWLDSTDRRNDGRNNVGQSSSGGALLKALGCFG